MREEKQITKEEFQHWFFHKATSRQVKFVNTYLKTLNAKIAYQAAGYNYGKGNGGVWKVYYKCFPYIQYKLKQSVTPISKQFIITKWMDLLQRGDAKARSDALKELTKLFCYTDDSTKINIQNNIPNKIEIKFDDN